MELFKFCFIFMAMPLAKSTAPGTFFWKPRLDLRLGSDGGKQNMPLMQMPTAQNVLDGKLVLITSFKLGMTILMLAEGLPDRQQLAHMDPLRGYFYTNAYRWARRHFSLIPQYLANDEQNYYQTHKVWKKRFVYMNTFLPKWMTYLFPYVPQSDWTQERREYRRYEKFAELAFAKHFKLPSKQFNDFASQKDSPSIPSSSISKTFDSQSKQ